MAKILSLFGTSSLIYVLKLPPNLFDVATAYLIYAFLRRTLGFRSAIVAASFYTFNPAIIFNTSIWGQFDAIYTFFLTLSLILILDSKPKYSVAAFTLGLLSKPQSIALAPLIAYLIAWKRGWKGLATSALVAAITTLIVISPIKWSSPLDFLGIYSGGYHGYPYTSINAFNVWAFHGFWKPDVGDFTLLNFFTIGWATFGVLTAFTLNQLSKIDDSKDALIIFSAFTLLFGFFMLPTRIHERYLFPVFSVLTLMVPLHIEARLIYGLLSFTYFSNQAYVLPYINSGRYIADGDHFVWTITLINLAVFLYTVLLLKRGLKAEKTDKSSRAHANFGRER